MISPNPPITNKDVNKWDKDNWKLAQVKTKKWMREKVPVFCGLNPDFSYKVVGYISRFTLHQEYKNKVRNSYCNKRIKK